MFPATNSNKITYEYFCVLGGLTNPDVQKIQHNNGSYVYYTYHLTSVR